MAASSDRRSEKISVLKEVVEYLKMLRSFYLRKIRTGTPYEEEISQAKTLYNEALHLG